MSIGRIEADQSLCSFGSSICSTFPCIPLHQSACVQAVSVDRSLLLPDLASWQKRASHCRLLIIALSAMLSKSVAAGMFEAEDRCGRSVRGSSRMAQSTIRFERFLSHESDLLRSPVYTVAPVRVVTIAFAAPALDRKRRLRYSPRCLQLQAMLVEAILQVGRILFSCGRPSVPPSERINDG
jgi:hypothetical protein